MQGVQIRKNEETLLYAAMTEDEAQSSRRTFYGGVNSNHLLPYDHDHKLSTVSGGLF